MRETRGSKQRRLQSKAKQSKAEHPSTGLAKRLLHIQQRASLLLVRVNHRAALTGFLLARATQVESNGWTGWSQAAKKSKRNRQGELMPGESRQPDSETPRLQTRVENTNFRGAPRKCPGLAEALLRLCPGLTERNQACHRPPSHTFAAINSSPLGFVENRAHLHAQCADFYGGRRAANGRGPSITHAVPKRQDSRCASIRTH